MPEKTMGEILSAILLKYWAKEKFYSSSAVFYFFTLGLPSFPFVPILIIHLELRQIGHIWNRYKRQLAALEISKIAKLMYIKSLFMYWWHE
jgi:hypothetical protein